MMVQCRSGAGYLNYNGKNKERIIHFSIATYMLVQSTIIIKKPIKEVWEFFKDPNSLKLWLGGFQRFEQVSGTPEQLAQKQSIIFLKEEKN
jgi:hypothetical protein